MKEKFDLLLVGRGGYWKYVVVLGTEILDLKRQTKHRTSLPYTYASLTEYLYTYYTHVYGWIYIWKKSMR